MITLAIIIGMAIGWFIAAVMVWAIRRLPRFANVAARFYFMTLK